METMKPAMEIISIGIMILGLISAWFLGKKTGRIEGFNEGIEFRNKQLKDK